MNAPLVSFHGDADLKAALLAEIAKHEAADQIVKGTYGKMNGEWHGCAIGCSLRSLNILRHVSDVNERTSAHDRFPRELGIPLWLAYAEDHIFEHLPDALATTWPRRFADAVPLGVDLTDLLAPLMLWTLADPVYGVVKATDDIPDVQAVVARMAALFQRTVNGETVPESEWDDAAWDARAARAARDAWAARAARDAWAARAAWDARAAWAARAAWDARDAYYPALSEELLRLLRGAARLGEKERGQ